MTRIARTLPASRLIEFVDEHSRVDPEEVTTHYRNTFEKWRAEDKHFTIFEADRRAVDLGFHGSDIWGWDEWIKALLTK